jgi:3-isopropylmalate/(R)-2-methylmalate dehydratase small subunit
MRPVGVVTGRAVPLARSDVDTDQIIPSEWLKRIERSGFGRGLFSAWRDDRDFVLNDERYAGASILVAGANFGIGSSREHAVWALLDYGFAAVVSSRFADIFYSNCTKQGLVPVTLQPEDLAALFAVVEAHPAAELTIDVARRTVEVPEHGFAATFELDQFTVDRLVHGWDDVALTMRHEAALDEFERGRSAYLPTITASGR